MTATDALALPHPALVVLEHLLLGGTLDVGDTRWRFAPANGRLSLCAHTVHGGTETITAADLLLGTFMTIAASLPVSELAALAATNAATSQQRRDARLPLYTLK